jgi:hypothetical protein
MKALLVVCLITGLLTSQTVFAGCPAPTAMTDVPNGATASRDQMLAALQAVKVYNAAVTAYAECMQKTGGDATQRDSEVDRLHKIADKFNTELRTFKARSGA